jgi:hypothetical protein
MRNSSKEGTALSLDTETEKITRSVRSRYWNLDGFLKTFNPSFQMRYCENMDRCFFGHAPTLSQLRTAYSRTAPNQWVAIQIVDLCRFVNAKPLGDHQLKELCEIIVMKYHWLKVTELMYFFFKIKSGDYGKFYGAVDPLPIMEALKSFIAFRGEVIFRKESEENLAKATEARKSGISYEQYLENRDKAKDK